MGKSRPDLGKLRYKVYLLDEGYQGHGTLSKTFNLEIYEQGIFNRGFGAISFSRLLEVAQAENYLGVALIDAQGIPQAAAGIVRKLWGAEKEAREIFCFLKERLAVERSKDLRERFADLQPRTDFRSYPQDPPDPILGKAAFKIEGRLQVLRRKILLGKDYFWTRKWGGIPYIALKQCSFQGYHLTLKWIDDHGRLVRKRLMFYGRAALSRTFAFFAWLNLMRSLLILHWIDEKQGQGRLSMLSCLVCGEISVMLQHGPPARFVTCNACHMVYNICAQGELVIDAKRIADVSYLGFEEDTGRFAYLDRYVVSKVVSLFTTTYSFSEPVVLNPVRALGHLLFANLMTFPLGWWSLPGLLITPYYFTRNLYHTLRAFRNLLRPKTSYMRNLLQLQRLVLKKRHDPRLEQLGHQLLEQHPGDPFVIELLARKEMASGNFSAAQALLCQGLQWVPNSLRLRTYLVQCYRQTGQIELAQQEQMAMYYL